MPSLVEVSLIFLGVIVCGIAVARILQNSDELKEIRSAEPEGASSAESAKPSGGPKASASSLPIRSSDPSQQPKRRLQEVGVQEFPKRKEGDESNAELNWWTDHNVNFSGFLESLSRMSMDTLSQLELGRVIERIDICGMTLRAAIDQLEVNQEQLSSKLQAAETAAKLHGRQAQDAVLEAEDHVAERSDVNEADSEVRKYQELLDSSRKETSKLKLMETKLGRKKVEILKRINELELQKENFDPNR